MLPFLKKKPVAGLIIENRKPDIKPNEEESGDYGLEACAQDLLKAIEMKDTRAMAEHLKSAYEILEMGPSEDEAEGPSYDELNQAAGKGQE